MDTEKEKERAAKKAIEVLWRDIVLPRLSKEMEYISNISIEYDTISWQNISYLTPEETTVIMRGERKVTPPVHAIVTPILVDGTVHFRITGGLLECKFLSYLKHSQAEDEERGTIFFASTTILSTTLISTPLSVTASSVIDIIPRLSFPLPLEKIETEISARGIKHLANLIRDLYFSELKNIVPAINILMLTLRKKVIEALLKDDRYAVSAFSLDIIPTNHVYLWRAIEVQDNAPGIIHNYTSFHYHINMTVHQDGKDVNVRGISTLIITLSGTEEEGRATLLSLQLCLNFGGGEVRKNLGTFELDDENPILLDEDEIITEEVAEWVKNRLIAEISIRTRAR